MLQLIVYSYSITPFTTLSACEDNAQLHELRRPKIQKGEA